MKVDNVSFTSKINFVDGKTFDALCRRGRFISANKLDEYVRIADEFYTCDVRTCTGGGVIDFENMAAGGFHYLDNLSNNTNLGKFFAELFEKIKNPDRAFIIGGKELNCAPYSIPNFKEICKVIRERVPKVTVLGEHNLPWSESHFHYSLKDDTWTINSMYRPLTDFREREVLSLDEL